MKKVIPLLLLSALSMVFGQTIRVGTSSLATATAFNNARKIARTLSDQIVIVYEDVYNNQNAIFYNYSDGGTDWQEPRFLDYGHAPALAVSDKDSFYLCYTKSNKNVLKLTVFTFAQLANMQDAYDIDIYYGAPGSQHTAPTLDVGPRFVHLAFQSMDAGADLSSIRYGLFHRDLEPATSIFAINASGTHASQPTLQTDLEFASDYVNFFWTEEIDSVKHIHHMSINADSIYALQPGSQDAFNLMLKVGLAHINDNFAQFKGCANPSFSIRAEAFGSAPKMFANRIIMGCDNLSKKQFNLFSLDYETDALSIDIRGGYRQSAEQPAWPSVDDIILNPRSCAIVWESSNSIFYGQSLYADIVTDPPEAISGADNSHYPSICYKTFRSNVFDVIWTAAGETGYQILYKRMDKQYWFDPIVVAVDAELNGTYGHRFSEKIVVSGGINNMLDLQLFKGALPDSLAFRQSLAEEFTWQIEGIPHTSGRFPITLRATDVGDDAGLFTEKNIVINIKNTAPEISVIGSAAGFWRMNEPVEYKINIVDAEKNAFDWSVSTLPAGLSLNKASFIIIGTGTLPAGEALPYETTFKIYSDDGDKQDTVEVAYKLLHPTFVNSDAGDMIPTELRLHEAYPNPFNPATTVKLEVPHRQDIRVEVYDLRGRLVTSLHDGELDAGFHSFTFDGSTTSSGSYFIRMQAGDKVQTQKCVLLK